MAFQRAVSLRGYLDPDHNKSFFNYGAKTSWRDPNDVIALRRRKLELLRRTMAEAEGQGGSSRDVPPPPQPQAPISIRGSTPTASAVGGASAASADVKKVKKKKVLLMGKSGSGKSSMRSIIFSNYVAKDTRRLGATIDIDLSHVKFLGNLTLNLWDCGGQEAFMENYLSQQRMHVFSNVGVLIYVFDIESRDVDRDMTTYFNIIVALTQYSPAAKVFVLIHKMDLIVPAQREHVFDERYALIRRKTSELVASVGGIATPTGDIDLSAFATSIWDQSLYKAWASIIHDLVPNLTLIEQHLAHLGASIEAEEIILFERTSFLVISSWTAHEGSGNPFPDRFERISNIMKAWKQSAAKYHGTPRNSEQFRDFELKVGTNFALFIVKFTANTFIGVVLPPGEARFNAAKLNTRIAADWFKFLDGGAAAAAAGPSGSSAGIGNSGSFGSGGSASASTGGGVAAYQPGMTQGSSGAGGS